jgi:hypothetical protein
LCSNIKKQIDMAQYDFSMVGLNLKVDRVVTANDFKAKSNLYSSPGVIQSVNSIVLLEDGSRKQTFNYENIRQIGGVAPTSLSDAMTKLSVLIDGV